jgi:hypothetical protein
MPSVLFGPAARATHLADQANPIENYEKVETAMAETHAVDDSRHG